MSQTAIQKKYYETLNKNINELRKLLTPIKDENLSMPSFLKFLIMLTESIEKKAKTGEKRFEKFLDGITKTKDLTLTFVERNNMVSIPLLVELINAWFDFFGKIIKENRSAPEEPVSAKPREEWRSNLETSEKYYKLREFINTHAKLPHQRRKFSKHEIIEEVHKYLTGYLIAEGNQNFFKADIDKSHDVYEAYLEGQKFGKQIAVAIFTITPIVTEYVHELSQALDSGNTRQIFRPWE
ncbi:unnamed protein product [Caenorhabditis sp. 36 PRJEB53466]|nr:unnamed protein product [Caenorhabditis sp. 36 PRJEB53466]